MKHFASLFLIFGTLTCAAAQTDLERRGMRGRVRLVEQYETYFCCSPNARRRLPKKLTGTASFNRKGGYTELISINNTTDGPHYERKVFKYDRNGRKTGAEVYRSEKNPPDTFFQLVWGGDGSARLIPERAEKLTELISYAHDHDGRLIEEISRDRNENLIMRRVYRYDRDGTLVRATVLKDGGVMDNESITVVFDDGMRSETTGIRPGSDVYRSILQRNRNGQAVSGESYSLMSDSTGKQPRYVLQNRTIYNYENGREQRMDWIFYKPDETPDRKIVILRDEGGEMLSREEFNAGPLPVGSRNENVEPAWILREKNLYRREYDRRRNEVRGETRQQCGRDAPLELTNIYEYVITYY